MHPKEAAQPPQTPPKTTPVQRGAVCPQCGQGILDYNGMLELECPRCGFSTSAGAGCT
ncbi:hypothetical protein GW781_05775 [bacterium]|nr:hypothetical protein [bacterium]NCT20644.1 hypothetical protein [bacterium]